MSEKILVGVEPAKHFNFFFGYAFPEAHADGRLAGRKLFSQIFALSGTKEDFMVAAGVAYEEIKQQVNKQGRME